MLDELEEEKIYHFWIDKHGWRGRWLTYSIRLPYFFWIRIGYFRIDMSFNNR